MSSQGENLKEEDNSFDGEEYTRYTMYESMLEGMGKAAFIDVFGGLEGEVSFEEFNKYIDKAILMNEYKNIGGE